MCVIGSFAPDGSLVAPVSDVRIEGLTVDHFGVGISAQGTTGLRLAGTTTADSAGLGTTIAFSNAPSVQAASSNRNLDSAFSFIGVSEGSITASQATANRGEGVVIINSTGVNVVANRLRNNCSGVSVVALGAPSGALTVALNSLVANNTLCLRNPNVNPQFAGIGVLLAGANDVNVTANDIRGHTFVGDVDLPTGGVVSVSSAAFGGSDPANNRVSFNKLADNSPDLFDDGTGTGISYLRNRCATSVPAGLCN